MEILDLGIAGYEEVLRLQINKLHERIEGKISDTLMLVEHHPVVTLGRISEEDSIIDRDYFTERGTPIVSTGRGGKVTYHAPGQLVVYPILDLKDKRRDIAFYIDFLEKTAARALGQIGVPAERNIDRRGVWAGRKKIAFTGIALKRWVTFHGISVNINNEIEPFSRMHPCGESGIQVTSAKEFLGYDSEMDKVKRVFAEEFTEGIEAAYPQLQEAGKEWN